MVLERITQLIYFLKGFIFYYVKKYLSIFHTIYYLSIGYSTYFCGKVPLFFYSRTSPGLSIII